MSSIHWNPLYPTSIYHSSFPSSVLSMSGSCASSCGADGRGDPNVVSSCGMSTVSGAYCPVSNHSSPSKVLAAGSFYFAPRQKYYFRLVDGVPPNDSSSVISRLKEAYGDLVIRWRLYGYLGGRVGQFGFQVSYVVSCLLFCMISCCPWYVPVSIFSFFHFAILSQLDNRIIRIHC